MSDKHDSQKPIVNPPSKSLILAGILFIILLTGLVALFILSIYTPMPDNNEPKNSTIDVGWASVLHENNLSRYGIPMREYRVRIKKHQSIRDYSNRVERSVYMPLDAKESDFMITMNAHGNKFFQKEMFVVMYQPLPARGVIQPQTFFVKLKSY